MRILVACEESQIVTKEFRAIGHEAYSCDIQDCSGGHPEWHFKMDAREAVLKLPWGMVIAHPPCTYLSNAGARHLYPKGVLNQERLMAGMDAKEFFMFFYNLNVPKLAIENPIPSKAYGLPQYTQKIEPYNFGDPYQKKTCLWLKGLPPLMHTCNMEKPESTKIPGNWFNKGGKERQKNRSKFWPGIAKAMAAQWG